MRKLCFVIKEVEKESVKKLIYVRFDMYIKYIDGRDENNHFRTLTVYYILKCSRKTKINKGVKHMNIYNSQSKSDINFKLVLYMIVKIKIYKKRERKKKFSSTPHT